MGENKDFKLMMELFKEKPEFRDPVKGPELLAAEMRKSKGGQDKETVTLEEAKQMQDDAVKAEQDRIKSIDEGLSNSHANAQETEGTPEYKQALNTFIMAGKRKGQTWTESDYKTIIEHNRKNST